MHMTENTKNVDLIGVQLWEEWPDGWSVWIALLAATNLSNRFGIFVDITLCTRLHSDQHWITKQPSLLFRWGHRFGTVGSWCTLCFSADNSLIPFPYLVSRVLLPKKTVCSWFKEMEMDVCIMGLVQVSLMYGKHGKHFWSNHNTAKHMLAHQFVANSGHCVFR